MLLSCSYQKSEYFTGEIKNSAVRAAHTDVIGVLQRAVCVLCEGEMLINAIINFVVASAKVRLM